MRKMAWERIWARKYSPFIASATILAFTQDNKFGFAKNKLFVPEGNLTACHFEASEYAKLVDNFEKHLRNRNLAEYAIEYEIEIGKLLVFVENMIDADPAALRGEELKTLFHQLCNEIIHSSTYQFGAFLVLSGPAAKLEKKMSTIKDGKKLMQIITTPYKQTRITQARLELLKMVAEKDKTKLKDHALKYAWIPVYEPLDKAWTETDFLDHFEQIENPEGELVRSEKIHQDNLAAYQKYLDTIEDEDFKKLVEIVHHFSYLKEMRDDYRRKAYWLLRPFLTKLAMSIGLSFEELNFLSLDEVAVSILSGKSVISKRELLARQESYAYILEDGKLKIYSGKEAADLGKKMLPKTGSKLKGMIASHGIATGKVSIIYHQGEFAKFKEGDILVTTMTHPEFLPIMKKASAIVTDEGGITCHAAIVARELGIPCIIGTKNATKVLKDGDLIEVDAENGIVKIIEERRKKSERKS